MKLKIHILLLLLLTFFNPFTTCFANMPNCVVGNPNHGKWVRVTIYDCSYNWTGGSTSDGWCHDEIISEKSKINRSRVLACYYEDQAGEYSKRESNNCSGSCATGCTPAPNCLRGRTEKLPTFTHSAQLSEWRCNDVPCQNCNLGGPC